MVPVGPLVGSVSGNWWELLRNADYLYGSAERGCGREQEDVHQELDAIDDEHVLGDSVPGISLQQV